MTPLKRVRANLPRLAFKWPLLGMQLPAFYSVYGTHMDSTNVAYSTSLDDGLTISTLHNDASPFKLAALHFWFV